MSNFFSEVRSGKRIKLVTLLLFLIALPASIFLVIHQTNIAQQASSLDSVRIEAETASLSGPAVIVTDSTASRGKAIELNTTVVTSPTPTPQPTIATPTPTQPVSGKVGWSSGFYVGWQQDTYPPSTIHWSDITHLMQFNLVTSTKRDGSIDYGTLTPAEMQATVPVAHQHHVKVLISIGGAGDNNWDAACSAANRSRFINNLVGIMQQYGYDGIDLDIEQDFGSPAHTDYIACVSGIRNALNAITPRPLLTEDGDPDWQAYMLVQVWQNLDQINLMSYWNDVSAISSRLNNYTSLGIPKRLLGVGIGIGDGGIDATNIPDCSVKSQYVVNNGYGGVMEWTLQADPILHNGLWPCMDAVGQYVPR